MYYLRVVESSRVYPVYREAVLTLLLQLMLGVPLEEPCLPGCSTVLIFVMPQLSLQVRQLRTLISDLCTSCAFGRPHMWIILHHSPPRHPFALFSASLLFIIAQMYDKPTSWLAQCANT